MKKLTHYPIVLGLALAACGDDGKETPIDGPPQTPDASIDASIDAPIIDPPPVFVKPTAVAIDVSSAGPDQMQSIIAGPDNTFLMAGFFADTALGARALTVFKLTNTGRPVGTFGGADADGFAEIPEIDFKGANDEIDIALQPDNKIVVSATVAAAAPAVTGDTDIAVVRLLADGTLDSSFGTGGIVRINLNVGKLVTVGANTRVRGDNSRGLTANANGIYVHAISLAVGADREDQDFTVVKLRLDNGAVDTTFGNQTEVDQKGQFRLNFDRQDVAARAIKTIDTEGHLLAVGYSTIPVGTQGAGQPVIYKLTKDGQLDPTFNPTGTTPGVFHEKVLTQQTEVYNVAVHGDKIVTGGYGREAFDPQANNYVSLRFDLATGARDLTWGGAPNGVVVFDPSGTGLGSNCRGAFALPDGKTLLVGSTGSGVPAQDAVFAVLDATGKLDMTYGGVNSYKLGAVGADGADQFWSAAVSGGAIAIVGYRGAGTTQTATLNDDSFGLLFPIE